LIARDENPTVRMTRSAFLLSVRRIAAFDDASIADLRGLLDVDDTAPDALRELAVRLALPGDFARVVEVDEARALTQSSVTRGGWWFAHGGWVAPRRYAMRLIESAGSGVSLQQARVTRIETLHSIQHVTLDDGRVLTAAAVVLANAAEATRLAPQLPAMQRLRGQLTELPSTGFDAPSRPITGDGYVMPALDTRVMLGATYEFDGDPDDPRPQALGHRENLSRLARLVGTAPVIDDLTSLEGRVGWRAINTDRLPSIGALDADEPHRLVLAGLGSRGVTWAALAGEQIAARLAGDPAPFERWIARATDPLRFARRRAGAA
jgi:tRNA 5-methylaminomethyl-2-thiouridine biosynthesis bifunctional protein